MPQPLIGTDVWFYEEAGKPLAAKVVAFGEAGEAILTLFRGDGTVGPTSGHFSETPQAGFWTWPGVRG